MPEQNSYSRMGEERTYTAVLASLTQNVAELIENVADSEGLDHDHLVAAVSDRLAEVYVPSRSPVKLAGEVVDFVLDWATDPEDPKYHDEDIAVNGYDEHNRARIATDLARAKFGATIGDVPPRV